MKIMMMSSSANNNDKGFGSIMVLFQTLLLVVALKGRLVQSWTLLPTTTPRSASLFSSARRASLTLMAASVSSTNSNNQRDGENNNSKKGDNKAMRFLRKIGRVGGNVDFTHAVGVDEGTAGKSSMKMGKFMKKTASAYASCAVTGIIDDISEPFPVTSFGTSWSGFTDQAIVGASSAGGSRLSSMATLSRVEDFHGRTANVLSGTVRRVLFNQQSGFIQMATNLANERRTTQQRQQQGTTESSIASIDASAFQGVQLDVCYQANERDENDIEESENPNSGPESSFYVHFKTTDCFAEPWSSSSLSYRAKFSAVKPAAAGKDEAANGGAWTTVQIPWQDFEALGGPTGTTTTTTAAATSAPPPPLDTTSLVRIGIVVAATPSEEDQTTAIGSEKVVLGISSVQFYKE